jgi:hypothetical protein
LADLPLDHHLSWLLMMVGRIWDVFRLEQPFQTPIEQNTATAVVSTNIDRSVN